jgi:Phosphotransferase enzyme family
MQNNFYAIIPHPTGRKILLLPLEDAWTLPVHHPDSSWTPPVGKLNAALQAQLGIITTVRHCLHTDKEKVDGKWLGDAIYVTEDASPDWTPPGAARWVSHAEFRALPLTHNWPRPHVEAYFIEEANGAPPPTRPPWTRRGWYAEISDWTHSALEAYDLHLLEPLEQVKQWDISSVLRARTDNGIIYVKAIPALFASEARITAGLARLFPGQVPEPLATWEQAHEGRLLLRDFGGKTLRESSEDPTQMEDALRLLARMQIQCANRPDELLAIGGRNRRIESLPQDLRDLLADPAALLWLREGQAERLHTLIPSIEEITRSLLSGSIPQSLLHGDFHPGNVVSTPLGYLIFDWTDACLSHPFFDLTTVFEDTEPALSEETKARHLAAYLGEWEAHGYGDANSLRQTCDLALKIAPLYHAVSYRHIFTHCEQATLAEIGDALPYYLGLLLKGLEQAPL